MNKIIDVNKIIDENETCGEKIIITFDNHKVMLGKLILDKKEELKKYRDFLMNEYRVRSSEKMSIADLYRPEFFVDTDCNCLCTKEKTGSQVIDGVDYITYLRKEYYNEYINSILIFNSLLGELDQSHYSNKITKAFIENGIYKYDSLDKIWDICSNRVFHEDEVRVEKFHKRSNDYLALRCALDSGDIYYNVIASIPYDDLQKMKLLRGMDTSTLRQLVCNSKILLNVDLEKDISFCRRKKY